MNRLSDSFNRNKHWLYFALAATFFWGLLAHGYGFLQSSFSHDSLNELCGEVFGNHFKFMTGRFLSPVYRSVFRTSITLPWLIGVLSLLWIGLSVFIVGKIFGIQSRIVMFLVAGILSTNVTVSATAATYMHDLDCDMVALLCAVAAVYLWKEYRHGWLAGALLVTMSLSFYQAYITVSIVLAMFVCILDILNEKSFKPVFIRGMKAIVMLLIGGCIYYFAMNTAMRITGNAMLTGQNVTMDQSLKLLSMDSWLIRYVLDQTYIKWYSRLVDALSPYPMVSAGVTKLVLALILTFVFIGILNRKVRILEKLLCVCLVALLPLAMNLMYVLTIENAHELMIYAVWLTYLLVLLLADWFVKWIKAKEFKFAGKPERANVIQHICCILVVVLLYGNVQTANVLYLKKDLEQEAYASLMTRVLYRMEENEEYVPGTTPVVFVGLSNQLNTSVSGFERYHALIGAETNDVLAWNERDRWRAYFGYILSNPAVLAEEEQWNDMQKDSRVTAMPCYPEDGCVAMVDDVLVVKLGEVS